MGWRHMTVHWWSKFGIFKEVIWKLRNQKIITRVPCKPREGVNFFFCHRASTWSENLGAPCGKLRARSSLSHVVARVRFRTCVRACLQTAAISHRIKHGKCSVRDTSLSLPALANETLGFGRGTAERKKLCGLNLLSGTLKSSSRGVIAAHIFPPILPSLMLILDNELSKSFPSGSEGSGPPRCMLMCSALYPRVNTK